MISSATRSIPLEVTGLVPLEVTGLVPLEVTRRMMQALPYRSEACQSPLLPPVLDSSRMLEITMPLLAALSMS